MADGFTSSFWVTALRKPLEELAGSATGAVRRKLSALKAESRLRTIHKSISSVQKVKTLWRLDREVKLSTFYYPSRVYFQKTIATITKVSEIEPRRSFIIQGTVGQGKSIFLRYLCIQELALARRVPVFVELRRFDPKNSFRLFLTSSLALYGIPDDEDTFQYLARSGKLLLLLDGFDEIEQRAIVPVLAEIELLIQRYPKLQIVITSRPDSGIEKSPHLRVYHLAELSPADHRPFLERIVSGEARVEQLVSALSKTTPEVRSLLATPLLMTLLVLVYNASNEIPPSLSAFFENLFHTLLSRHDRSKPGFQRQRASKLSDTDLKHLFEAFCYAARQRQILVLSRRDVDELLTRATAATTISCRSEDFTNDIIRVTCLMQQEGLTFQFIHKSVAEFHAASFVAHTSDENARRFYTALRSEKWKRWQQELVFLAQIDRYRYLKHYLIPSLAADLAEHGGGTNGENLPLTKSQALSFLNAHQISIDPIPADQGLSVGPENSVKYVIDNERQGSMTILLVRTVPGYGDSYSESEWMTEAVNALAEHFEDHEISRFGMHALGDLIAECGAVAKVTTLVNKRLRQVKEQLTQAQTELQQDAKVGDFVDP